MRRSRLGCSRKPSVAHRCVSSLAITTHGVKSDQVSEIDHDDGGVCLRPEQVAGFRQPEESEFATSDLDDDERFSDLQLALAMFGASDREYNEKMLVGECKYALRILKEGL